METMSFLIAIMEKITLAMVWLLFVIITDMALLMAMIKSLFHAFTIWQRILKMVSPE